MRNLSRLLLIFVLLENCSPVEKREPESITMDPHSFSVPADARVTHLKWKASVDFETKSIQATATWKIEAKPDADVIILDTKPTTGSRSAQTSAIQSDSA